MKPEEVASLIERLEIIDKESIDRPDLRTIDVDVVAREAIAHIASLEAKLKTAQSWDDIESGANEKLQATIKAQHLAVISLRERNTELLTYCESLDDHEATLQATIDELNKYKSRCNTDYRSYAETLEGKVKTLQATITSQEASIELLETDKRCKRIIIDRATETIRKERATITEQQSCIRHRDEQHDTLVAIGLDKDATITKHDQEIANSVILYAKACEREVEQQATIDKLTATLHVISNGSIDHGGRYNAADQVELMAELAKEALEKTDE